LAEAELAALAPQSPEELADALAALAAKRKTIRLGDAPGVSLVDTCVHTRGMGKVLQYEPRDLTIRVEAGLRYSELTRILAAERQMVPLDPPWADQITVAGALAANLNGSRRRLYGTGRDLVIGMTFATLEGKLVQTGGMVVKNVAGLDMGKLMIGSFGTLAAIATVNFKLNPIPKESATFVYSFASAEEAFALRDRILKGQLQPAALDLLDPSASVQVGLEKAWNLVMLAVATPSRFEAEYRGGRPIADDAVWPAIREFTAKYLASRPGVVARCSTTHMGMKKLVAEHAGSVSAIVARAASGIVYLYDPARAIEDTHVLEHAPEGTAPERRWPSPGSGFPVMRQIKDMFDPQGLLNKGALYGRI
jgi:glycolate oxidase FAD binding subunit